MDKCDYEIVSAKSKEKLVEKVRILGKLGWYPVGGVIKAEKEWHQAMAKYERDDDIDDDDDDNDDDPKTPGGGPSPGVSYLSPKPNLLLLSKSSLLP